MLKLHQVDSDSDESDFDESSSDDSRSTDGPGDLLRALERRQDDVLAQLDALNERVESVLRGLGVRLDDTAATEPSIAMPES